MTGYVHGYEGAEARRLGDQAATLAELLHHDSVFTPGARVLEAGCGTGAQTTTLARNNPSAHFDCVDVSGSSLSQAKAAIDAAGLGNVRFHQADIRALPFEPASFDDVFVCFVLEHLRQPVDVLTALRAMLRPGGRLTVIEGDHGSTFFHPESAFARAAIDCQVRLQAEAGGDATIGRRLYPLLRQAGFMRTQVSPRFVYVDDSRPAWVEGFTRRTFTAMIEGVRGKALDASMMTPEHFDRGIADLKRTAEPGGVFCYTFFKAVAFAET